MKHATERYFKLFAGSGKIDLSVRKHEKEGSGRERERERVEMLHERKGLVTTYLVSPVDSTGWRIRADATLEIDVVAFHDVVGIQIAAKFKFHRRSNFFFWKRKRERGKNS